MKNFEKWCDRQIFCEPGAYKVAKIVWRAALEWTLKHKKHINYKDYKFDWIKTDIIEEELNE